MTCPKCGGDLAIGEYVGDMPECPTCTAPPRVTPAAMRLMVAIDDLERRPYAGITGRPLAKRLWPDAPGWKRHANCGPNGSTTGAGMPRAAGCQAGRIARRHDPPLVMYLGWEQGWTLTAEGRDVVKAHRQQEARP